MAGTLTVPSLAGARALSYRKLFDGRAVQSTMTADEVLAVCAAIRSCRSKRLPAP